MLREYDIPPRDRWPAPIQAALVGIPAGTDVRASRFAEVPSLSGHNWFYPALGLLAIVGYGSAMVVGLLGGPIAAVLAWCVAVGLVIGGCLAVYRDYRGAATSPLQIAGLTAGAVAGLIFLVREEEFPLTELIQWFLLLWLGSTIPILIGFYLTRWVMSRFGIGATPAGAGKSPAKLSPDLDAATDHRRARAVLRLYPADGAVALAEDRAALEPWGYDLREQVVAQMGTASPVLRIAAILVPEIGRGERLLWALFLMRSG